LYILCDIIDKQYAAAKMEISTKSVLINGLVGNQVLLHLGTLIENTDKELVEEDEHVMAVIEQVRNYMNTILE
jgi:hydrogenase maturation factor